MILQQHPNPSSASPAISHLREDICLPFILNSQNSDGGWGYRAGLASAVEPTAWARLALTGNAASGCKEEFERAAAWLRQAQRADGSWPVNRGGTPGSWLAALACLALLQPDSAADTATVLGIRWLCNAWPGEGNLFWRVRRIFQRKIKTVVQQDHSLRAWGWTPGTASWVEPTCWALILLQNVPQPFRPSNASQRESLAERMLYDRICPGGGWGPGNPMVYGVAGQPKIVHTAWALLALRAYPDRAENVSSLDWLERICQDAPSCGSLALALLCLRVYGRHTLHLEPRLEALYRNYHFFGNVVTASWIALALGSTPKWLGASEREMRPAIP